MLDAVSCCFSWGKLQEQNNLLDSSFSLAFVPEPVKFYSRLRELQLVSSLRESEQDKRTSVSSSRLDDEQHELGV